MTILLWFRFQNRALFLYPMVDMEMKDGCENCHFTDPKTARPNSCVKNKEPGLLSHPWLFTQSSTTLCPLHTKQALPHYPEGSADSHGLRNVSVSHWSKTPTTAQTETTLVYSLQPVIPHSCRPFPNIQYAQATIRKPVFHTKQDTFLQSSCPAPIPPKGSSPSQALPTHRSQRVHNPEEN